MYVAFYNLCRTHETLRTTPAVALGIADRYCRLAIYWMRLCVPNVWPAPDLQVDFCDLVSISLH
jgi:hypothetical protein